MIVTDILRKPILILCVAALLGASCGDSNDTSTAPTTAAPTTSGGPTTTAAPGTTSTSSTTTTTTATTTTTVPAPKATAVVYFLRNGKLAPTGRSLPVPFTAEALVAQLLAGVQASEIAAGFVSLVPAGTRLRSATVDGDLAIVDLSAEFASGGGSMSVRGRVAQIVYTLHRALHVGRVTFKIDGVNVGSIAGEGFIVTNVRPTEFEDFMPNVIVESPTFGAVVGPNFVFQGLANVFEGTVNYELIDDRGRKLAEGFATGAMGFWGEFRQRVMAAVSTPTEATFVVFTISPKDGARLDQWPVPLRIDPSVASPPEACSARTLSPSVADQSGLPAAVAAMRADLARAAVKCDYEALRALADRNGVGVRYSFGPAGDPIGFWRAAEEGGHSIPPMFALRRMLDAPYAKTVLPNGGVLYAWPDIHAAATATEAQLQVVAALGVYQIELLRSWFAQGSGYLGYRILINESGDWTAFVAGD